jgi:AsmA-like C-terminal region
MKLRWVTIAILGVLVAALVAFALMVPLTSGQMRKRVIATLSDELQAEVELADLQLQLLPHMHANGAGLVVRHKGRRDVPPIISVKTFSVHGSLLGLWRKHVANVELNGLDIEIPPDHDNPTRPSETAAKGKTGGENKRGGRRDVVIDNLVSNDARLVIIPRKEGKRPKVWDIHRLLMHNVGATQAMPFQATLTNAIPPGEIGTKGEFGPWHSEHPGQTPLDGTFTFDRADLSVFKGISGILSAHGNFAGVLERIDIHGETETPQFTVAVGGHPVPLHTKYHAVVDGTNGDTVLERIDGSFLNTSLVAKGAVIDAPGKEKGRTVTLDVTMDKARIEDVLKLAVKAQNPMTGALKLTTKLVLPPGEQDVVEKLQLDGQFAIGGGRFTNLDVQNKINELSHRGSGKPTELEREKVASDFTGRFALKGGVLELPSVTFDVPGAAVELNGRYALRPETLEFHGNLLMDAKVSETTTGIKSVLLKVVDPLFRKDGKTVIPIKIGGNRNAPSFGLDARRVFHRDDKDDKSDDKKEAVTKTTSTK